MVGIVGFLAPLIILMVALFAYETVSDWLMLPYCAWVVYDVWWVHQLWHLNRDGAAQPGAAPESAGARQF